MKSHDDKISKAIERTLQSADLTGNPGARDGVYARSLRKLPPGLRAIAATYYLDLSLALDSIDWHFLNFTGHAKETLEGLRFLQLEEMAVLFERTHELLKPHLTYLSKDNLEDVYDRHGMTEEIQSLCARSWEINKLADPSMIMRASLDYAAAHPELLKEDGIAERLFRIFRR